MIFSGRYLTSLVKPIYSSFIVFDAVINGIIFITSLCDSLLLEYRNGTDFSILTSNPAALLNSLINLIVFYGYFHIFYV